MHRARRALTAVAAALALLGVPAAAFAQPSFITFESGHVRPLALSPDGGQLFAVNTPDNRLEVFDVGGGGLTHVDSIPVGMEPVAVAARTNDEVWVVNHLSDRVSIVDRSASPPRRGDWPSSRGSRMAADEYLTVAGSLLDAEDDGRPAAAERNPCVT